MVEVVAEHHVDAELLPRIILIEICHYASECGLPALGIAVFKAAAHGILYDIARFGGAVVICPSVAIYGILGLHIIPQKRYYVHLLGIIEVEHLLHYLAVLITLCEILHGIGGKAVVAVAFHKSVDKSALLEVKNAVIEQQVLTLYLHSYHSVTIEFVVSAAGIAGNKRNFGLYMCLYRCGHRHFAATLLCHLGYVGCLALCRHLWRKRHGYHCHCQAHYLHHLLLHYFLLFFPVCCYWPC